MFFPEHAFARDSCIRGEQWRSWSGRRAKCFRVVEEKYGPQKTVKTVPKIAYAELGFRYDMTVDEAKARAKQINLQNKMDSERVAKIARRVERDKSIACAFLPEALVNAFEAELAEMYLDNAYRLEITLRYWSAAKLVILELALDPKDFRHENQKILNYFKKMRWSHDYIKRITRMLNLWGSFCSRKRGTHFESLPRLTAVQVQSVVKLREDVKGIRRPAEPLTWHVLKNAKDRFERDGLLQQWNWMFIATWFGLRPSEVDNLKGQKFSRILKQDGIEVLEVYQTKLVSFPKDQRWKPIPIFFEEQKAALELIKSGEFKRPLNKTLRRLLGDGIETYSPRKGFTDLFLERRFGLEDISTFLGHQSIEMTWAKYKSRRKFNLPKGA